MEILGWFFLFIFSFYLFFRIFGKIILGFLVRKLMKKAQEDLDRQTKNYEEKTESSPFRENIVINPDLKVSVPKGQYHSKRPKLDELPVEDIEFEDTGS